MKTLVFLLILVPCPSLPRQTPAPQNAGEPAMTATPKITPFLWFDADAEEAIRFYSSIFPGTKVLEEHRWGPGGPVPAGTLMTARIRLAGQELMLLNGGPTYRLNEAFSLFVACETQAQVDDLWERLLSGGGEPSQCGWLKDRFGLSWQIIPTDLPRMLADRDPVRAARVTKAMMFMVKLDVAKLQAAYKGR